MKIILYLQIKFLLVIPGFHNNKLNINTLTKSV